jgi:LysR family transcriptional regulator, flagellar master operon regulator
MYRIEEADRYRVGDLQCGPLVVYFPVGRRGKSTRTFGIVATGCGNECRRSVRLRGGMQVEEVVEEKLAQIRTSQRPGLYVYVDWGPEFRRRHDIALPEHAKSSLYFNLGPLALQYILQFEGSEYFRTRVVSSYLDRGVLERVKESSEFSYPVYVVYPQSSSRSGLQVAKKILRRLVKEDADWSQRWDFLI